MTDAELQEMRAKAAEHNQSIRASLRTKLASMRTQMLAVQAEAEKLITTETDDFRLKDNVNVCAMNWLANFDQIMNPILNPPQAPGI